jgi:transposase-like protein
MRELSVAEQRYQAVLAVIKDGRTVTETAAAVGVSRQALHAWLAKYEAGGLEGLVDGSHRPAGCPHQMPAVVEAAVLEARRRHPSWGPRRIAVQLTKSSAELVVSESSVYRCRRCIAVCAGPGWWSRTVGGLGGGTGSGGSGAGRTSCGRWTPSRVPALRRLSGEGVDRDR